uniref:Uncharacterized protein n=1 Tax=Rhizophora mucronata TaxID=61149 RepID=A0A2P2QF48_RHIMU
MLWSSCTWLSICLFFFYPLHLLLWGLCILIPLCLFLRIKACRKRLEMFQMSRFIYLIHTTFDSHPAIQSRCASDTKGSREKVIDHHSLFPFFFYLVGISQLFVLEEDIKSERR